MTRANAEASAVLTNTQKPSVLRRDMVNEIPPRPDNDNEFGFSNAHLLSGYPKKVQFCQVVLCTLLNKSGQ